MAAAVGVSPVAALALVSDEPGAALTTLTDLAVLGGIPPEMARMLWEHLDVDPLTDMEAVCAIPPEALEVYIQTFVTENEISAGKLGRITLLFKKLREGTPASAGVPPEALALVPSALPPAAVVSRGQMAQVLDQTDASTFERLDPAQRSRLRKNYQDTCGGPPMPDREPSPDQLAAMLAKLNRKESPYADFAVFQPHGRRLAKYRLFEAQIFVDGALTTRQLKGPLDFQAWESCWEVLRNTLISLGAVSPATLDAYKRGISQLNDLHPQQWGIVYMADELLRSELWQSVSDGLADTLALPDVNPWDYVIRVTTYGGPEATQAMVHWWYMRVTAAIQHAGSSTAFVQRLEGTHFLPTPDGMSSSADGSHQPPAARGNAYKKNNKSKNKGPYAQTGNGNHNNSNNSNNGNQSNGKGKGKDHNSNKGGKGHGKGKGGGKGHGGKVTK